MSSSLLPFDTSAPPVPSSLQAYWLTRSGSLTAALYQLGTFSLKVIKEGETTADEYEALWLGIQPTTEIWERDVVLYVDDQPMVYAHTIVPRTATDESAAWRAIRHHGQQPLATLLYRDQSIQRTSFSWLRVHCPTFLQNPLYKNGAPLWTRHSRFTKEQQPLVVAEAFLEAFWCHPKIPTLR